LFSEDGGIVETFLLIEGRDRGEFFGGKTEFEKIEIFA
jgi:hypothetical protein